MHVATYEVENRSTEQRQLLLLFQKFCSGFQTVNGLKDDTQRFFTKLMQKSFLAAYCNINPSV